MQTPQRKILIPVLSLIFLIAGIVLAEPGDCKHRFYYTEKDMIVRLQESLLEANALQELLAEINILEIETGDGHMLRVSIPAWRQKADARFLPGDEAGMTALAVTPTEGLTSKSGSDHVDFFRRIKTDYSFRIMDHVLRLVHDLPYDPIFLGLQVDDIFRANDEVMEALEIFRLNGLKHKVIERLTDAISKGRYWPTYLKNSSTLGLLVAFAEKWDPDGQLSILCAGKMKNMSIGEICALYPAEIDAFKNLHSVFRMCLPSWID